MTTDLSALTAAADSWDKMAGEFQKRGQDYKRDVHGISMGQTWVGLSADAANRRFDVTLKEFQNAQTEAKSFASLLRDAHTQFVDLRGKLKTARQEAIDAGMKVSDQGVVSYDTARLDQGTLTAYHHDPGFQESVRSSVSSWQDRIEQLVKNVEDADKGVEIAFNAVVLDSNAMDGAPNGFNGGALGDIEKYEAQKANDIATRLAGGETVSSADLAELRRSFRDNSDDKAFSQTFLNGLGTRGTIKLTNELNDLIHVRGKGNRSGQYAAIETGLANTLATATKDTKSEWYKDWRTGMQKAGVERYATDVQGARLDKAVGYQSLVTLMRKGNGYAPDVLEDLTDDMIKAEKSDPGIWQLKHEYNGKDSRGWFANDPVDGMLGIMSRDPDTAARYLNSDDNMKYFMKDRDWNVTLHEHEGAKASHYSPGLDGDDRAGFGAALQAAATGIDPSDKDAHYVEHSKANNAVFKSAFNYLADSGDDYPPSLREPMANILVNRGDAVHASMSEIDTDKPALDQNKLFEIAKQVSKNEDAYATLNGGLNQAMVADIHEDHSKKSDESLLRAGRTVGFLEEARVQAQGDPETAEFGAKPLIDKAISYIPVASGDIQEGFDYVTGKWLEDEQKRIDEKATEDNVAQYENRKRQLMALADVWNQSHGGSDDELYGVQNSIDAAAEAGIRQAHGESGKGSQ
ncbi:hypothetical protein AB0C70_22855 [Streptomyces sp. NPDC048564]|uniref:hypothetical protein n=1 Tax=Streptomyces sp. NPDC048564 TaxID=3155760 RepID=UPI003431D95D